MQAYGAVRQGKVVTVVFEQQNIYNNSNINDTTTTTTTINNNNNNNNAGKRTLKYSDEYFIYGWRGTTYHLSVFRA
jgi:hypothetical protein